jgi:hypothetical protein
MEVGRGAKGNVIHHTPLVQEMRDASSIYTFRMIEWLERRELLQYRYSIKLISFTVVM